MIDGSVHVHFDLEGEAIALTVLRADGAAILRLVGGAGIWEPVDMGRSVQVPTVRIAAPLDPAVRAEVEAACCLLQHLAAATQ